jgi:hypothetical protein
VFEFFLRQLCLYNRQRRAAVLAKFGVFPVQSAAGVAFSVHKIPPKSPFKFLSQKPKDKSKVKKQAVQGFK